MRPKIGPCFSFVWAPSPHDQIVDIAHPGGHLSLAVVAARWSWRRRNRAGVAEPKRVRHARVGDFFAWEYPQQLADMMDRHSGWTEAQMSEFVFETCAQEHAADGDDRSYDNTILRRGRLVGNQSPSNDGCMSPARSSSEHQAREPYYNYLCLGVVTRITLQFLTLSRSTSIGRSTDGGGGGLEGARSARHSSNKEW